MRIGNTIRESRPAGIAINKRKEQNSPIPEKSPDSRATVIETGEAQIKETASVRLALKMANCPRGMIGRLWGGDQKSPRQEGQSAVKAESKRQSSQRKLPRRTQDRDPLRHCSAFAEWKWQGTGERSNFIKMPPEGVELTVFGQKPSICYEEDRSESKASNSWIADREAGSFYQSPRCWTVKAMSTSARQEAPSSSPSTRASLRQR
jgi:hypothetical protein